MKANGFRKGDIIRVKKTGQIRIIDEINERFCPPIFIGDDLYLPDEIEKVYDAAKIIAKRFCLNLRNEIGEENLRQAIDRNNEEKDQNVCHSHDFCDSNVTMQRSTGATEDEILNNDGWTDLWNDAWKIAKAAGFDESRIK